MDSKDAYHAIGGRINESLIVMNFCIPAPDDLKGNRAKQAALRLYIKIQLMGPRQARIYKGMILTYPIKVPRGYGTRGRFLGVYTLQSRLEWIEEDILSVMSDSNPCLFSDCKVP